MPSSNRNDGSNSPADLNAMVTSLTSLRDSLLYSANSIDTEGRYVFSGTATATAPIAYNPDADPGARYSYAGNTNDQTVVVANGITQVANQNVDGVDKLLNQLDQAIAALQAPNVDASDPATRTILKGTLDGFDAAMDLLSGKVAVLGGQQNILKTLDANHANVSLSNQTAIGDIGQADIGAAAIVADLKGVHKHMLLKLLSPETLYALGGRLFNKYYDTGKVAVITARTGYVHGRYEGCTGFDQNMWAEVIGASEQLLEMAGAKHIRVRTLDGGNDEDYAEIEARWSR